MDKILIFFCVYVAYFVSCSKTYLCVSSDNEEAIAMSVRKNGNVTVLFPQIVEGWEEKINRPELTTKLFSHKNFILDRRWEELPIFKNETFLGISGNIFGFSVFFLQKAAKLQIKNGLFLVYDIEFVTNDSAKEKKNCQIYDRLYLFEIPETDWLHIKIVNNQENLTFTYNNINCVIEGNFSKVNFYVDNNNLWKFHNYSIMMVDCNESINFQNIDQKANYLNFYASGHNLKTIHFVDVNDTSNKTQKNFNDSWNYLRFSVKRNIFLSLISSNYVDSAYVSHFTLSSSVVTRMVKYESQNSEIVKCHFINKENQEKLTRGYHNCKIDESKYCSDMENCEICCKGKCYQMGDSRLYRAYVFSFFTSSAIIVLILIILIVALIIYSLNRKNSGIYEDFHLKHLEPENNVYQEPQDTTEFTETPKVYYKYFDRRLQPDRNIQRTSINMERRTQIEQQEPLYCTYVTPRE